MQNIPSSGDILSPAEKFFKRRFRSDLPTLDPFFNPVQINEEGRKRFKIGDQVRIQNAVSKRWDDFGTVREIRDSGRSYYIDRGRDIILRNLIFLKLIAPPRLHLIGQERRRSLVWLLTLCFACVRMQWRRLIFLLAPCLCIGQQLLCQQQESRNESLLGSENRQLDLRPRLQKRFNEFIFFCQ
jgi:hypothetical protein